MLQPSYSSLLPSSPLPALEDTAARLAVRFQDVAAETVAGCAPDLRELELLALRATEVLQRMATMVDAHRPGVDSDAEIARRASDRLLAAYASVGEVLATLRAGASDDRPAALHLAG